MDNAAVIALATALEIEFGPLERRLKLLADDAPRLEAHTNELLNHLPAILGSMAGLTYARGVLESILATHYAEGVGEVIGSALGAGKLMRPQQAYDLVRASGALQSAPNTLSQTRTAIDVRASALAKILKGQIVQDVRSKLLEVDKRSIEDAQTIVREVGKSIEDLASDPHVFAHAQAQSQLAKGYGIFSAQQTEARLKSHPLQEFYRAEHRTEWRDWPRRWSEQGGSFYKGASDYPEGRMIALVGSKIWEDLSNPDTYSDATGSPYPPFAYNSGMSVKPVSVAVGKRLGLYGAYLVPAKPRQLDFNAGIAFSADYDDDIKLALLNSMQDWVENKGEELVYK